jgi:uncharacterized protein YrrD
MQPAKDLCKKPIYRVSDGQHLGDVRDFYLDPAATQMIAVFLGKEGVFTRKTLVLPMRDIQLQGLDCWLSTPQAAPIDLADWQGHEAFVLVEDLRGRMIQTVHQFQIGTVKDVVFDEYGRVVAIDLAKVLAKGPLEQSKRIARAAFLSLGDKKTPMVADLDVAARAAGTLG